MIRVYAAVAQKEQELISERTRAVLAAAKARGAVLGRGPGVSARSGALCGAGGDRSEGSCEYGGASVAA